MTILSDGFNHINTMAGNVIRVRYYTNSVGSVWDDENTYTQSGTDLYISGAIATINAQSRGSSDELLMEAGRIRYNDSKIMVNGSIQTTSGNRMFTFAVSGTPLASGNEVIYREIEVGVNSPQYAGVVPVKKVYVRELQGGSLF